MKQPLLPSGGSMFTPQRLVLLTFFLQPVAFGSWLPRIPEVQTSLQLGPAALAVALLGLPCGTLATLPFAGGIVARIGARAAILWGFVFYSAVVALPALSPDPLLLFVALVLAGSAISFVELGLNVMADQVERASGKLVMNTAHGCWSLGIMAGSLIGSMFAAVGLVPWIAILLVAGLVLPVALLAGRTLPVQDSPAETNAETRRRWRPPGWALIGICCFVFGITMTEGAMADWSAIFLRDALGAGSGIVGLGYSLFALMVAAGRFGGDAMKRRFGAVGTARLCGALAVTGAVLLYLAPTIPLALVGFGIIGIGVSVGFPLAVTAAASVGDRPASANLAVLSFVALTGFLIGPPLIGFVAELGGIRLGIACLVPVLLVSLALTGRLATRPKTSPVPGV